MNNKKHTILGIHIQDRKTQAQEVQKILTNHGRNIKSRLGLHEVKDDHSDPNGIIILELIGTDEEIAELTGQFDNLDGIDTQTMIFTHDN